MDPLRDMRWAARADRSTNRSMAWRAAKVCIASIVVAIITSLTDDRGPLLWRVVADFAQRWGIVIAALSGAWAILAWIDSRRRSLLGPRSTSSALIVLL